MRSKGSRCSHGSRRPCSADSSSNRSGVSPRTRRCGRNQLFRRSGNGSRPRSYFVTISHTDAALREHLVGWRADRRRLPHREREAPPAIHRNVQVSSRSLTTCAAGPSAFDRHRTGRPPSATRGGDDVRSLRIRRAVACHPPTLELVVGQRFEEGGRHLKSRADRQVGQSVRGSIAAWSRSARSSATGVVVTADHDPLAGQGAVEILGQLRFGLGRR